MSRRKRRRPEISPAALLRRRVALGAHLLLQVGVLAGSQGAWWDVFVGGERVLRHTGYDPARAEPMEPLAAIAALAAIVAFFFASYDLVADADLHAPVLLASVVVLVAAGALVHRVVVAPRTIEEITEEVLRAGQLEPAPAPAPDGAVAPVDTSDPMLVLRRSLPTLQPAWGMALLTAAAPLMVALSVYLTFFAERASESS